MPTLETVDDIIEWFQTLIGDSTDLSSFDTLRLLQETYDDVLRKKEWEFLKKEATGSVSGTDIPEPDDFDRLLVDPYIYIGSYATPWKGIPFGERRSYVNQNNFFYYDARQQKFVLTRTKDDTYSLDYIYTPPALNTESGDDASAPVFPKRFWWMLPHKMATDNDIINLSEKARSYAQENQNIFENKLTDMADWSDSQSLYRTYGT